MDYTGIIKRYWYVLRNNRTLWSIGGIQSVVFLFQFLVTIGIYMVFMFYIMSGDMRDLDLVSYAGAGLFNGGILVIGFLAIFMMLLFQLEIFVSDIALFQTVARFDQAEEKITLRQAIKYGWSIQVFRLLGLQLIWFVLYGIGLALAFIISFGIYKVLEISIHDRDLLFLIVFGVALLVFGLFSLLMVLVAPAIELARRICILEDKGVMESMRSGFSLFAAQPLQLVLMSVLIMVILMAQNLVISVLNMVFSFIGFAIGALAFVVIGGITAVFSSTEYMSIAMIISMAVTYLVSFLPMGLMYAALYLTYTSIWTLVYNQVAGAEATQLEPEAAALPG